MDKIVPSILYNLQDEGEICCVMLLMIFFILNFIKCPFRLQCLLRVFKFFKIRLDNKNTSKTQFLLEGQLGDDSNTEETPRKLSDTCLRELMGKVLYCRLILR